MLKVTLTLGSHSRRIDGRELVDAIRASPTLATLVRLATASTGVAGDIHGEEGVGVVRDALETNGNVNDSDKSALKRSERKRFPKETHPRAPRVEERAAYLADVLQDQHSLAWYRQVVARVPESVIRDALARARDLPEESVRRSRAAYFTSLVRPHLAPYAHPPTNPS